MRDAAWEPRTFAIGERVRIRLSGECRRQLYAKRQPGSASELAGVAHLPDADGRTGTIVELPAVGRDFGSADHPYAVQFDVPILALSLLPWGSGQTRMVNVVGDTFAGAELAPVEAPDAPAGWGDGVAEEGEQR